MKKERNYLLDNVKFLLIVCIVVGLMADMYCGSVSVFQPVFLFIYSFHMPLLFFVCGLLHTNEKVVQKVFSYFALYSVMKLIIFATSYFLNGTKTINFFKEMGSPWIMLVLALCVFSAWLLRNQNMIYVLVISVIVACFVGYDQNIGDFLALSRYFVFFPFYWCGACINASDIDVDAIFGYSRKKVFIASSVLVLWLLVCFLANNRVYDLRPLFTGRNHYNDQLVNVGWLARLLCYAISSIIGTCVLCLVPSKKLSVVSDYGNRALQVYFWESCVRIVMRKAGIADKLFAFGSVGKLAWLVLGFVIVLVLAQKVFGYIPLALFNGNTTTATDMRAFFSKFDIKGNDQAKKKFVYWSAASSFTVFTFFFYGPLAVFLNNSEELWFGMSAALIVIVFVSICAFCFLVLFGMMLPDNESKMMLRLLFGGTLAAYLQGNLINANYGVLDGSDINWSDYTTYAYINTIVWMICIILPFAIGWYAKKKKNDVDLTIIKYAAIFLTIIQIPAALIQSIQYTPNSQSKVVVSTDGIYDLASDQNVITFILDTFDEVYFEQFMLEHPEYEEKLADFVHYDNYIASGGRTIIAMPSLLTGQPFKRETLYSEYITSIWNDDNILKSLDNNQVDVRVFTENLFFSSESTEYIHNVKKEKNRVGSYKVLGEKLYKLTSFVFAPHVLKREFEFNTAEFDEAIGSNGYDNNNDAKFIREYREDGFVIQDYSKALRVYLLNGVHAPFKLGKDGKNSSSASRSSTMQGLFNVLIEMMDDMKQKGVYDNATIIITGDHGDKNVAEHPLFLYKSPNQEAEYTNSDLAISGYDVPLIWGDAFGVEVPNNQYGMHLDELATLDKRERHYFYNTTGSSKVIIKEYVTNSTASDTDAFVSVNEYADDESELYKLGETLRFDAESTGNKYAQVGFEKMTGWRTPLCGHESILRIPIESIPEEDKMTLTIGFISVDNVDRNAQIYINDNFCFEGIINKSLNKKSVEIEFPTEYIADINQPVIEIRFVSTDVKEDDTTTKTISLEWLKIQ